MNMTARHTHNFNTHPEFDLKTLCDAAVTHYTHNFGSRISARDPSGMRVNNDSSLTMSTPSFDAHQQDDHANSQEHPRKHQARSMVNYESTSSGDVVVVEPSFDADDNNHVDPKKSGTRQGEDWQQRGPAGEKEPPSDNQRSSPGSPARKRGGHRRDLSAHFYEAASLTGGEMKGEQPRAEDGPSTISPAAGQKHRRVFSGDVSNPPQAHRRINSIGKAAPVKRQYKQHQRVDSAGLDVLTAAADASREELAAAAGRPRDGRNPWEPPSAATTSRRSPIEMSSYDYSTMNAPPPRSRLSYPPPGPPPGPPVPAGYMSTPVGPHMGPPPPAYPPQQGYPPPSYYHPPPHGYPRAYPPPSMGYPVQYSRGPDPYMKHPPHGPPQQPTLEQAGVDAPGTASAPHQRSASNSGMTPPPPVPPSQWRGAPGTHQGVQTFVTAIGVGDGSRTMRPSAHNRNSSITNQMERPSSASASAAHHRKLSSFSSIVGPLSSLFPTQDPAEHPLKGHHRSTSSSVSFLTGFDVGLESSDAAFLQNLQASNAAAEPPNAPKDTVDRSNSSPTDEGDTDSDANNKLAPGGTSKRVRRKCTIEGCANRVVQGGLCISHGAKRKTCKHPGCDKNVKKAGLCSSHGPARRRCDADGCSKVAVQGGKCIAHGAKKKLCIMELCTKQAILAGMCKKHHDQSKANGKIPQGPPGDPLQCKAVGNEGNTRPPSSAPAPSPRGPARRKGHHTRGLSIFQDLTADAVGTLLSDDVQMNVNGQQQPPPRRASPPTGEQQPPRHNPSYSQEFGMY